MLHPPHSAVSRAAVQSLLYIITLKVFKGVTVPSECFALPFIHSFVRELQLQFLVFGSLHTQWSLPCFMLL